MLRTILLASALLVLLANSPVNAQRRSVFDWPWGMGCAQIEREYGESKASLFSNLKEEITYQFDLFGQTLEVIYWCNGRGMIWGDGELTSVSIVGKWSSIKREKIMTYCEKVSRFLQNKYGRISTHLDKQGPNLGDFGVSYFYNAKSINTKVHLFCQERFGGGKRSKFMSIDIKRINPYF